MKWKNSAFSLTPLLYRESVARSGGWPLEASLVAVWKGLFLASTTARRRSASKCGQGFFTENR